VLGGVACGFKLMYISASVLYNRIPVLVALMLHVGGVVCDGHHPVMYTSVCSTIYRIPVLVVKFSILFSLNHSPYERAISYTIYYHITVSKSLRSWNVLIWVFIPI
jgi:hypothetical protein